MRDLLLAAILVGVVPVSFRWPWMGTIAWTWVSLMYPHRLTFGFAQDLPIAAIVGGATLVGFVMMPAERRVPQGSIPVVLALFLVWMCVTSIFAIYPSAIGEMFVKVMKIQVMIFVTMALIHNRKQLEIFVWVIVVSLGFYGVKGGLFTLRHGGVGEVAGPAGSFIAANNEIGLALTMVLPLMYYGVITSSNRWAKSAFVAAMILTAMAALGTQSRGALLAVGATTIFLWVKNPQKLRNGIVLSIVAIALVTFMPESWVNRMGTIRNYEDDGSAEGRLNAWRMAWNLAVDRPIGGGFEVITPELFQRYAPNPLDLHAAHSIYFQVLGEHGFPGLFLFLLLWLVAWRTATWVKANALRFEETAWAARLAMMVQVSMIAYLVGGAFLSLAYFDLPYDLLVILVVLQRIVDRQIIGARQNERAEGSDVPRAPDGVAALQPRLSAEARGGNVIQRPVMGERTRS